MEIISKEVFVKNKDFYLKKLKESIFIYPTDTIYGIGCDATNEILVKKIRDIKVRDDNPFSVIAPSKDWIKLNCDIKKHNDFLNKLSCTVPVLIILPNNSSKVV